MDTQHESAEDEHSRLNERFVRWQDNLRQSLSSHTTLIVSWSAGGLAFCGAILNSHYARFERATTWALAATAVLLVFCLTLSLYISWNRLRDTRATLKILKTRREKGAEKTIEELQKLTKQLGEKTWCAVNWQLACFGLASISFVVTIYFAFKDKLNFF